MSLQLPKVRLRERARGVMAALRNARTIAFSQFGEDVLLYNLRPAQMGSYLDVGAFHPKKYSNTYKLYLRGWSGVTVEPNPDVAPLFKTVRPRDAHLTLGISADSSTLTYYKFRDPEFNSFDGARAAHSKEGIQEEIAVACSPLQDVVDAHFCGRDLDLLSVDCEGLDLTVLRSLDWSKTRPTAIIVEDFEQFENNFRSGGFSPIRTFLADRHYALFTQCMFSFLYVDRRAYQRSSRDSGFLLQDTQMTDTAKAGGLDSAAM